MIVILKRETMIFAENYFCKLLKNKTVTRFCTPMTTPIIMSVYGDYVKVELITITPVNQFSFFFFSCIGSGRSSDF